MAGDNPHKALEAFVERLRATIRCIANTEIRGSTSAEGVEGSLVLIPRDGAEGLLVPLRCTSGHRDLQLSVRHSYTIVQDETPGRGPFKVHSLGYMYDVLDRNGDELLVFHWHPDGKSSHDEPHIHLAGMTEFLLPPRPSGDVPDPLDLSKAHIPTRRIFLEDIVRILITAFDVDPLRDDWDVVLADNLEAVERGRTWY